MKSSRERMRKDEMQLTISLIPLAIESNRLFPSEEIKENTRKITLQRLWGLKKNQFLWQIMAVTADCGYLGRGR